MRSASASREASTGDAGNQQAPMQPERKATERRACARRCKRPRRRLWRGVKPRAPSVFYATAVLKWTVIVALCLYVGFAAVLYVTQRSLMYFPETIHTTPAQAGLPEAEEVPLTASDGVHITAWYVAPQDGKPVIVYFHGNGGALRYRVGTFQKTHRRRHRPRRA